ncbi:hypothetical protein mRhiFer1_009215 [Rhinolophus ferrumequinum]|uniref:Gamma-retroviral matrix protein domain-containing protein n=1 Tax=Rhinolophus ferrumequinum TaxID=59479 RepID=A0A7J7S7S5_RHIFE|nr:hypothetical protein mRhiFer1_009215 [Rhinolophus ferrumequinum]
MTLRRLHTLCELEWPGFDVGWPPEGTLDLPMIRRVYVVVTGTPGHPDQFPYVDSWLEIARTLPPWVRFCSNSKAQSKIFVAWNPRGCAQKDMTKIIYQGDPEEELPPPLYTPWPTAGTAPLLPDTSPPSDRPPRPTSNLPSPPQGATDPTHRPSPGPASRLGSKDPPQLQLPCRETRGPDQVGDDGTL